MLLDAASLYFRAFYGVKQPLPAPDGTPTNAVRGFLDMMSTLLSRFRATDMVACIDTDWRPAWRVALVPSYKTHRLAVPNASVFGPDAGAGGRRPAGEAEPPGLAEQVPIILEALAALGVAAVGAPEHEADDVIATLAERATMPVDVVTGDRDLFQLIDDARAVRVLYTGRGVARLEVIDAAALVARFGILPEQYADFATIRDPSDGLPGVPGIGAKTAASLLATFGTLEALLDAPPGRPAPAPGGAEAQRRSGLPAPGRPGRPHRLHAGPPSAWRPRCRTPRPTPRGWPSWPPGGASAAPSPGPSPPSASPRPPEPAGAGARALDSARHLCYTYLYV